ncbi:MAG TPA: VOC family protein [Planctomycetota bacterium]|nr:VOC family protein [Planctomycetota bacterium]
MRCLRLTHVNLRVGNLPDAVRFYTEVLGLEPIPRNDRGGKGAWFRLGPTEVHLAEDPSPQPRSKRHFAVEVADLAEARRHADQKGAEIDQEDVGRFWMRDPSGNRIEIVGRG